MTTRPVPRRIRRTTLPVLALVLAGTAVAGCTDKESSGAAGPGAIEVRSTDDACTLSATSAPAGNVVFEVTNDGSKVTEFYLLDADDEIVSEVENIGPGLLRTLVVTVDEGAYTAQCKPGMTGDGISEAFEVTEGDGSLAPSDPEVAAAVDEATTGYLAYVRDEAAQLLTKTEAFAAAYAEGRDDEARAAYADTRVHWERIEPVAESFGDLDPKLDLREADLEDGQEWTGWHRIEKDLWPPADDPSYVALTVDERREMAELLVADTRDLVDRTADLELTASQLGNGAKELLDEVATGKVTGEEEIWSHTDLWDFQANIDGARKAYELLRPALLARGGDEATALAADLDREFDDVQALLDEQRAGEGFTRYTDLTDEEIKALADAVDALAEPLSRLTAAVVL